MPVEVNSAALEAVIEAAEQLVQIKNALGLPAMSYVLGDDEPTAVETSIEMLQRSLNEQYEKETQDALDELI